VGETGKIYLTELDEAKVAALGKEASRKKLKNVEILAAAEKETNSGQLLRRDVLRRVYHHFTAPNEWMQLDALAASGRLARGD